MSQTFSEPDTATKGIKIKLNLGGVMTSTAELSNVNINVLWNKTPLYKEDHPMSTPLSAGDPFTYSLAWDIPSFAPSGHYLVTITVSGKVNGAAPSSIGCTTAEFDL